MDKFKNFGFLLKDLSNRYVLRFEQHASEISLTLMQCKVLVHLEKSEGASQARLAELTGMDAMSMVRIVDRMEADHLLERRADPADRRARRLYLTKKAKPLLEEVWRLSDVTRAELFTGVSRADREMFLRVLERMHENALSLTAPPLAPAFETPAPAATLNQIKVRRTRAAARTPAISGK